MNVLNYRSIDDLDKAIVGNLHRVPRDVQLIVGIPRSGLLAANILALHLNLPMTDLEGFLSGRLLSAGKRRQTLEASEPFEWSHGVHALVIDDSVREGKEIIRARKVIGEAQLKHRVTYASVFVNPDAADMVDLAFELTAMPRVFEWNIMHHFILSQSCLDMDGVLCVDPTARENDDGPLYREFLLNARPFLLPTVEIGWIVTSRLEKYRAETETWLRQHSVNYRELRMLNLPSKEERIRLQAHVPFKAGMYQETGAKLFVESSLTQAREIARKTGKPVFCTETRELLLPPPAPLLVRKAKGAVRRLRNVLKRFKPQAAPAGEERSS